MKVVSKLKAVEGVLSAKQIAWLQIEKSLQFRSPRECVVAMMDGKISTGEHWGERVRASVKLTNKGASPEQLLHLQREALREAWFLIALAGRCVLDLEHAREAIGFQRKFVHALAMTVFLTAKSKSGWLDQLPDPVEEAEKLLFRVRGLRDAVRLIEQGYFGGRPILFADIDAWLKDEVNAAETLVDLYNQTAHLSVGVESPEAAYERAREVAAEWVTYTRADIHEKMDEREQATATLRSVMGTPIHRTTGVGQQSS